MSITGTEDAVTELANQAAEVTDKAMQVVDLIARANRLSGQTRDEFEAVTVREHEGDELSDEQWHATLVWASIGAALTFSTTIWSPELSDAEILEGTEAAMLYVQINSDLEPALAAQFRPTRVDVCPRCDRSGQSLCTMPSGAARDRDHLVRPHRLHRDYRRLLKVGDAWVPQS